MDDIVWHIEPSGKCTLACPGCDRTIFYNRFKKRETNDINIDHMIKFFKDQKNLKVNMCGNNGDPIYHKQFHKFCKQLKDLDAELVITTNGSHRKRSWWIDLVNILDSRDTIRFSIDGLQDTNHLYRVNSDWSSIMDAVDVCNNPKKVRTSWKFIPFKHNQHQIHQAEALSKELGFDEFKLNPSDRWWDDTFKPDESLVDPIYKHQLDVVENQEKTKNKIMKPFCLNQKGKPQNHLYIDSDGDFYPCCYQGLYAYRYKDVFDPRQKKYNIADTTAEQILKTPEVGRFFESTKNYESASLCCKIYCGQDL